MARITDMHNRERPETEEEREARESRARTRRLIRNTLIALLLILAGVLVYIFRDDINLYEIKNLFGTGMPTQSPAALESTGISYESAESNSYGLYGDYLAVLTKAKLTLYERDGTEKLVVPVSMTDPVLKSPCGKTFLFYDNGEEELYVADASKVLYHPQMDQAVLCAGLNQAGYLVVVNSDPIYKCVVTVYDPTFKELFRWCSADDYVVDASVSEDGKRLALAFLGSSTGNFASKLSVFDLGTGEERVLNTGDSVILSCRYRKNGSLYAVYNNAVDFYDGAGNVKNTFNAGERTLMLAASADGEYLALALSGTGAEQVIWLDSEGKQSARAEVPGTIKSMDCRAGNLAVLTEKQLILFDRAGGTLGQAEVELDARKAVLAADGSCMLFGMNRLYVYH